ncbi:hypothetical protein FIBSPDRAFT_118828 [Athelia psychrophila]|uniref:MYND-type domain-containing protein n=1 Tax=Athelia psychrophila TaxID=1759441 RepID=A0A166CT83_9AGAM|nr:hypothetical protein FIBSPDRAFT_118828 [Fibularhizoctonia sp. CBS 109695]
MRKAWPTMWIWIQHVYQTHLQLALPGVDATRKAFMAKRYEVFVTILKMFADHGHTPMVSGFISGHAGILPMMADMWIREGTDKNAENGFRCALFNVPRVAIQERFLAQIILACGTADEAVHVACQRVEHHLGQAQREYSLLSMDLTIFMMHLCEPSDSPLAAAMYASSGVATTLMHAWAHIASSLCTVSVEHRSELLDICMISTFLLVQRSPQAYDRILDILYHDLLPLLLQSVALIQPSSERYESFATHAVSMIHEILSPATVHRETLSLLGRCVAAVHKRGKHLPMRNPSIRGTWSGLMMLLDEREKVYNKFKSDSRTVLLCGNAKCENPNSGMFHRCSACRILLYCSQKCQRAHWNEHKVLCNNMKGTAKGDTPYPSLSTAGNN